jgi:hypothetical protein
LKALALTLPAVLLVQSALGGWIRHLGGGLFEHVGFALVVLVVAVATTVVAFGHGSNWLKANARLLLVVILAQLALGVAAWISRFGWPQTGYVAVQGAPLQVVLRTGHAVTGLLLFVIAVTLALRVARLDWLARRELVATVSIQGGPA